MGAVGGSDGQENGRGKGEGRDVPAMLMVSN